MASPKEQGLSKRTLAELREFHTTPAAQEGGSEAQARKLRQAIEASPLLLREVNRAIGGGEVQGFRLESNPDNNGSYSPKDRMIRISPRLLDPLDTRPESQGELIFVTAHEIRHSLDKLQEYNKRFFAALGDQARQRGHRDYTDEVRDFVLFYRDAEARAEIDGFNAVVSKLKQQGAPVTLDQIYNAASRQMRDFIDKNNNVYTLKSNLQLDADMYLPMNERNIAAMGVNFFDKIGAFAHDYPDFYGAYAIQAAIDCEQQRYGPNSTIYLDMQALGKIGIDGPSLVRMGVDMNHIDTTPPAKQLPQQNAPAADARTETADKLAAMMNSYGRIIDAYRQGDMEAFKAARQAVTEGSPAAQSFLSAYRSAEEAGRQQLELELEQSRYSLENMPAQARLLYGQLLAKLTDYARAHNLPYSEGELHNSAVSLAAAAYAQKMSGIERVGMDNGQWVGMHTVRGMPTYVRLDAEAAALTPEREGFKSMLQTEQQQACEAEQREMERQEVQSRGMGLGR